MKQNLLDKLKQIPVMMLDIVIDYDRLYHEVTTANNEWFDYRAPFINKKNLALLGIDPVLNSDTYEKIKDRNKEYKQCGLITYHPKKHPGIVSEEFAWSDNGDMTKITHYYDLPYEERKWYYTVEAKKFPYLMSIIPQITDHPQIVKLIRARPGDWLGWHSHQNDPIVPEYNKPEQAIIHIPIRQHPDVAFMVSKLMPENRNFYYSLDEYKNMTDVSVNSMTPKNVYFLNSYYPHTVKNFSNEERIDIIIYSDTTKNPTLEDILENAVSKYAGITMEDLYV